MLENNNTIEFQTNYDIKACTSENCLENQCYEEFSINLKFVSDEIRVIKFPKVFFQKNVKEFKTFLFPKEMQANKVIKLIYKGRLLQDSDNLATYSLLENDALHVVYGNDVNNIINNEEEKKNNDDDNQIHNFEFLLQIQRRGFEKLIDENYMEEDLECLREIYHVGYQIDKYSYSRTQMIEKEENLLLSSNSLVVEHLAKIKKVRLEKEKGTYYHFIIGFILGYFFNILVLLVMVFLRSPKNALVGTLVGFLLKLFLISYQNINNKII